MTGIEPTFVRDGLAVYIKGTGRPVFLMPYPHGYTRVRTAAGPLFSMLADMGGRVITFDPPGAYDSDRKPDVGMPEMLACASEVMEMAEIETPVDVVGHSMGGLCSLALAIEKPGSVKKMVIIDSMAGGAKIVRRHKAMPYNWNYLSAEFRTFVARGASVARGAGDMRDHKILQRLVMNASYHDPVYLASHLEDIGPDLDTDKSQPAPPRDVWPARIVRLDLTDRLGEITADTLVITGAYDPQVPASAAAEMGARINNCQLSVYENSAHYPFIEEPDRFKQEVGGFLFS